MTFSLRFPAAILLATAITLAGLGQNPPPQDQPIKVTTNLVEVRAVVKDKQGRLVTNLKREDFEILENKQAQEINFFSVTDVASKAAPKAPPAGEAGKIASAETPARTVVLFVDNLHLSDSSLLITKQALKRFVAERLTDDDLVALVTSGGTLGLFSQFTRDRRLLQYAVDKIGPRGGNRHSYFTPYLAGQVEAGAPDALTFAIAVQAQEDGMSGPRQLMENIVRGRARQMLAEATWERRVTLATLRAVAERMASLPGQRLIVMLSDGFTLYGQGGSFDTGDLEAVTSKAAVAGVLIYSIDAKGLQPPSGFDASLSGPPLSSSQAQRFMNAAETDLQQPLNALARDTGGEPSFNTNDLAGAMRKALDDNSSYYAIGYYSTNEERDSKFRRVTVRIRGHAEYKVRAQQGYLPSALAKERKEAAARTPQQRFVQAITAPLAVSEIGIYATADYIETEADAAQVSLQVFIDGANLTYHDEADRHSFDLALVAMVFDASGKQVSAESTAIKSNLLPATFERGKQVGFRYTRRLQLKPGFYQIRVGVREVETEHIGTGAAWVDVPNLARKKLQLSSILLTDAVSLDHLTLLGKENVTLQVGTRQGIKGYRASDMLGFYLRVYPPDKGTFVYQIEIRQGDVVVATTEWIPVPQSVPAGGKGIELGRQFPLKGLAPGIYDLRVLVRETSDKKILEQRAAFEVVP
jgi:VWFA-related protein